MSYQAAFNSTRREVEPEAATETEQDEVARLLAFLKPGHLSSVQVGRIPAVAVSNDLEIAERRAASLLHTPEYVARTELRESAVSKACLEALIGLGATVVGQTQVVRGPIPGAGQGLAVPCAGCGAWLWFAANTPVEARCVCGQHVVREFSGEPTVGGVPTWARCMNCGCDWGFSEPEEGRNPWRYASPNQTTCAACHQRWGLSRGQRSAVRRRLQHP